jgi:7,8-dihydro-6-hydroxymethylpterin-pyrophosphokinase
MRTASRVFLSLGSNLGDRKAILADAVRALAALPKRRWPRCTRLYDTAPWGVADQPRFSTPPRRSRRPSGRLNS